MHPYQKLPEKHFWRSAALNQDSASLGHLNGLGGAELLRDIIACLLSILRPSGAVHSAACDPGMGTTNHAHCAQPRWQSNE